MNKAIRILGISGSLRQQSFNAAVLRAAAGLAPAGVVIETFELGGIPLFNQDDESNPPAAVVHLKRRVRDADGILFVTPEYNYSVPGVLKNAIDWGSRPYGDNAWDGKPAAIMGASVGAFGTARAQYHLRQIFVFLNVYAVNRPEVLIANAAQRFDAAGNLNDEPTKDYIRELLTSLVELIERNRRPVLADSASDGHTRFSSRSA
jgi:chromate reductase